MNDENIIITKINDKDSIIKKVMLRTWNVIKVIAVVIFFTIMILLMFAMILGLCTPTHPYGR